MGILVALAINVIQTYMMILLRLVRQIDSQTGRQAGRQSSKEKRKISEKIRKVQKKTPTHFPLCATTVLKKKITARANFQLPIISCCDSSCSLAHIATLYTST